MVKVADGKYEVLHENGAGLRALRYGEPWRDLAGDGLVLALVHRIEELEAVQDSLVPTIDLDALAWESIKKAASAVPSREEVWLRIYAAVAGAFNSDGPACRSWADKALEAFDERFPPK